MTLIGASAFYCNECVCSNFWECLSASNWFLAVAWVSFSRWNGFGCRSWLLQYCTFSITIVSLLHRDTGLKTFALQFYFAVRPFIVAIGNPLRKPFRTLQNLGLQWLINPRQWLVFLASHVRIVHLVRPSNIVFGFFGLSVNQNLV